jgi:hypothetical protein
MNKQRGYLDLDSLPLSWCIGLFVAAAIGWWIFGNITCSSRWEHSGLHSRFGVMTGCMVQYKGRWIPEDRYRATDE